MKNDALNFLNYSTVFIPGVNDPISVGLKVIPSHLTSFDHGGYSADPDFNILLSNYIKYLVRVYDFLVAKNVSASLLINDRAISRQLSLLVENLNDSNFDGSKNEDLRELSEIIKLFLETDAALDTYMGAKGVKNIFSEYVNGSDFYIDQEFAATALAYAYLADHEIEQLFNAFGWPEWANDFDPWAVDENYQTWLNTSGDLMHSRLFYDAMVALGDPAVRYWSALNTGNDDFAYAFTRRTDDGVYFRTNYQGNSFITGTDGFRAYQPYNCIMDLSLMDRVAITNPFQTSPAFAMPDLSKTTISPQLTETFIKMDILLYNVNLGIPDYTEGGYNNQAFLGYSMFSPEFFGGTPLAEVVTKGTRYTFGQNNIYPGNSLIVNSNFDYEAILANATAAAWNAVINSPRIYRPDEVVISRPEGRVYRYGESQSYRRYSLENFGLTEVSYGLGAAGLHFGAREYSNVVNAKMMGIEIWRGKNNKWNSLDWGGR